MDGLEVLVNFLKLDAELEVLCVFFLGTESIAFIRFSKPLKLLQSAL